MGIDIIATKDNEAKIIQCKRWVKEKTLHEKHIFQLYGSSLVYGMKNPDKNVIPVFVTTTNISDLARECAKILNVVSVERFPFCKYPLIKCNKSKNGEKIFHLPFDQQYDRVVIEISKGEKYAWTVDEAISYGFRRAFRWRGS